MAHRGRLVDNHAAVDFARTVFGFDAPGFWDLVHAARLTALEHAARNGVELLIQTSCDSHPEDLALVEDFERTLAAHDGVLLPVYLSCSPKCLEERVGAPDCVARRKVTSREGLARCLARFRDYR